MGSSVPYCPMCRRPMTCLVEGEKRVTICPNCDDDPLESFELANLIKAVKPPSQPTSKRRKPS